MATIKPVLCSGVLLFSTLGLSQRLPDARVEVYVPTGMPIRIEVTREEEEQKITKYNIKRIVGPEVKKVTIVHLLVEAGGKVITTHRRRGGSRAPTRSSSLTNRLPTHNSGTYIITLATTHWLIPTQPAWSL